MASNVLNVFEETHPDQIFYLTIATFQYALNYGKQAQDVCGVPFFMRLNEVVGKFSHCHIPRLILTLPIREEALIAGLEARCREDDFFKCFSFV